MASGPRDTDEVWAPHWYAGSRVDRLRPCTPPALDDPLPDRLAPLLERCCRYYEALAPYRIPPRRPHRGGWCCRGWDERNRDLVVGIDDRSRAGNRRDQPVRLGRPGR